MDLRQCNPWLNQAGYRHHCFISYPHQSSALNYAKKVRAALIKDLEEITPNPQVFIDVDMPGGTQWAKRLERVLCHSLTMVAICTPMYFDSKYCGREWAAMERIRHDRLPNADFCNIIPLLFREPKEKLPQPMASIQYINLTGASLASDRYYNTREFKTRIRQVVEMIEKIGITIAQQQRQADCAGFKVPRQSAFAKWNKATPAHSFWGK